MKTITYSIMLLFLLLYSKLDLRAQSNIDLTERQISGYTLFGLGFTTIALTYSGYNDADNANQTNERAIFYSIGTGIALTGVILLVTGPKKKTKSKAWSGLSMAKTPSPSFDYKNFFYKK